jgi:hypothetical protein
MNSDPQLSALESRRDALARQKNETLQQWAPLGMKAQLEGR